MKNMSVDLYRFHFTQDFCLKGILLPNSEGFRMKLFNIVAE